MKISCQSCQAKYTIADEKVLGKIVKIRCKKCSATIVINGNELPGAQSAAAYDYAGQSQDQDYTVNVADGDQRTMTVAEIADAYRQGTLNDETFCWKDGMPDWLPLREIGELYAAATSGGGGASAGAAIDVGPTSIQEAPREASIEASFSGAGNNGDAAPMFPAAAAPAPTAARRAGGRAPAADLFGTAAQAGGEEDVMTSAPAGIPQLHETGEQKLTGARNENSVLFSLSALTSSAGPATVGGGGGGPVPERANLSQDAGSGLIDIRALSRAMEPAESKPQRSKIDDIMNLGGGGAFAPALNAPILAPPPLEALEAPAAPSPSIAVSPSFAPPPPARNKKILIAAIGGGVGLLAIIGIVIGIASGKKGGAEGEAASATAADSALAMNTPTTPTDTNTPTSALPQSTDTATSTATTAAPSATKDPKTKPSATASATTTAPTTTTTATTTAPTATAKSDSLADALNNAAGKTPTAPTATQTAAAGSDQPFNMGEARARLAAIAGGLSGCKRADGPTGSGRVVVTFAPSGGVQSAVVQGPFSGTPVGACIAGRFSGARVPPFSPPPFSVSKSFSVN
jgi:predicted Zn finger-like uncharacterized protein